MRVLPIGLQADDAFFQSSLSSKVRYPLKDHSLSLFYLHMILEKFKQTRLLQLFEKPGAQDTPLCFDELSASPEFEKLLPFDF
jgi:hypothetical protein